MEEMPSDYRGWIALTEDGQTKSENQTEWKNLNVDEIVLLGISRDGQKFFLPEGKRLYFQRKGASAEFNGSGFRIESRVVGFREDDKEFSLRVSEDDGTCKMEAKLV